MRNYAALALRVALGASFLYSVADRFALLGPPGSANVSWGTFARFSSYVATLNWYVPKPLVAPLAWMDSALELVLGLTLIAGLSLRISSLVSALLLLAFATTMAIALGIGAPLAYSVFSASAAAFLLAAYPSKLWSLDQLFLKIARKR
ncbi:MAG TPA: MauE/DoxX family redox-associated membrane protein [Candidatus Tumulicola sp.]|jgi:uncharacterized membrane protein YphA (DoxX/SURF4 family)